LLTLPSVGRKLFAAFTLLVSSSLVISTTAPAHAVSNEFYDAASAKVDYRATPVHSSFNCASLVGRRDAAARIVRAYIVPANRFTPSYCDVRGVIAPRIQVEVALPLAWNQRLYVFGNGGFAGEPLDRSDRLQQVTVAINNGFAVAQTDTGHQDNAYGVLDGSWALNRPDLVVDYAYRAIHETNVEAKKLVRLFYSHNVEYAYFNGCSDGGREAYEEAQKFPDDFDGIVGAAVFAAGIDTNIDGIWALQHILPLNFTVGKFRTIGAADVAKCDALDGDVDGIIGDPRRCHFSATKDVRRCVGQSDADSCLTAAEAAAYDNGLGSPVISNGRPYFPRYPSGPEANDGFVGIFLPYIVNKHVLAPAAGLVFAEEFARYIFPFPASGNYFTVQNFNFDTEPARVGPARRVLNALSPDIAPFLHRGGKMITYTGWADPLINPYVSVGYYENVARTLGEGIGSSFRLFMVPGMHHCSGGPGADAIDAMTSVIDWTERGIAPAAIIAHKFTPTGTLVPSFTRKLCPYPQEARYVGSGINKATSFRCIDEGLRGVPDTPIHEE